MKCNKSLHRLITHILLQNSNFTHNQQYVIFNSSSKAFSNLLPISIYIKNLSVGFPPLLYLPWGGGGGEGGGGIFKYSL